MLLAPIGAVHLWCSAACAPGRPPGSMAPPPRSSCQRPAESKSSRVLEYVGILERGRRAVDPDTALVCRPAAPAGAPGAGGRPGPGLGKSLADGRGGDCVPVAAADPRVHIVHLLQGRRRTHRTWRATTPGRRSHAALEHAERVWHPCRGRCSGRPRISAEVVGHSPSSSLARCWPGAPPCCRAAKRAGRLIPVVVAFGHPAPAPDVVHGALFRLARSTKRSRRLTWPAIRPCRLPGPFLGRGTARPRTLQIGHPDARRPADRPLVAAPRPARRSRLTSNSTLCPPEPGSAHHPGPRF